MKFIERKRILFFGLPWTFTRYTVSEEVITINAGLLHAREDDCYMYKVQDVKLHITLPERIFRLGTVECFTADTTHRTLLIEHVRNAREIKDFILTQSEMERQKRRTLTTQDITGYSEADTFSCDDGN